MRFSRMRGWVRLGIVLSVVWAAVVFFYVRKSDMERAGSFSGIVYSTCSDTKALAKNYDFKECRRRRKPI
jgi:hypothetical protein